MQIPLLQRDHLHSKQINKYSSSVLRNPPEVKQEVPRTLEIRHCLSRIVTVRKREVSVPFSYRI